MRPRRRAAALTAWALLAIARPAAAEDDACVRSFEGAQEDRLRNELLRAKERLETCERACPVRFRDQCTAWRVEVEQFLSSVRLEARTAQGEPLAVLRAFVDARPVDPKAEIFLVPGDHAVRVETAKGPVDQALTTRATEHGTLVVVTVPDKRDATFATVPPRAPSSSTPSVVLLVSAGATALGATALAVYGHVERGRLSSSCAPKCEPDAADPIRAAWWTAAGLGAASAALLVTGLALLPERGPRLAVGLGALTLTATF